MSTISKSKVRNVIILAMALAVASLERMVAEQVQYILAYPSAYIASFFLGASPIMTEASEVLIPMSNQFINVTSKCSAFGFFCLLYAILTINVSKLVRKDRIIWGFILALPVAYVITLMANGCRIICAYYSHIIGQMILPMNFQATLHQGVGIAIFLSTLVVISLTLERINCRERRI